jgi:hypothetical protein
MKLKLFKEAEAELQQFENFEKPHFFYEFQSKSYPNRTGCMIAFGFRMLHAELPQYLNRHEESLASLYKLLHIVDEILSDLSPNKNESNPFKICASFVC